MNDLKDKKIIIMEKRKLEIARLLWEDLKGE